MEPLEQLNSAMHYIDSHLANEIDFKRVAQLAGCSEYHFRRMFSFLSGMALGEYIRLRRLSQAALELRASPIKVIDVAVKYGYGSPDAFSRAFYEFHGLPPSEARHEGAPLKVVPPMTFQLTIRGGNQMDYRIIEKDAFYIVGLKQRVKLIYNGVNPEIAAMWQSLTEDDIKTLMAHSTVEPKGFISGSVNFTEGRTEGSELDQLIGVATNAPVTGKWHEYSVPASTWAVFTVHGKFPDALQAVWGRIYAEWFPISGYESTAAPELLWNESADTTQPDYHSEIWIPVMKK